MIIYFCRLNAYAAINIFSTLRSGEKPRGLAGVCSFLPLATLTLLLLLCCYYWDDQMFVIEALGVIRSAAVGAGGVF